MPAQHDEVPTTSTTPGKAKRKDLSMVARNLMMVAIGVIVFAIVATVVLYGPITYGDEIPNFGIILMLTVPVIAGVAFRVGLDAFEKLFLFVFVQLLRIVQSAKRGRQAALQPAGGENHCGGDDRTGQRAATGLIHAGDTRDALFP